MECRKYFDELIELKNNFERVNQYYQNSTVQWNQLNDDFNQIFVRIINLQRKIDRYLHDWKKSQQKSIISGMIDLPILNLIQKCYTVIMRIYLTFLESAFNNDEFKLNFFDYTLEIEKQLCFLLQNAFLVIEQPCSSILKHDPLTIISNAKFEVKLCLLFNYQKMPNNWRKSLEYIDMRLLVEDEIRSVLSEGLETIINRKPSFNINKVEPRFNIENETPTISIVCNLKVDINRRGHNPKAIPVAEKKFKFIFWFKIDLFDKSFVLHTFSLPVNVLSRKDYRNSYATIIWDNAFALDNREMFETRDAVTWQELATILNMKFHKDVGINLLEEHLNFIYTMIPNHNDSYIITWEQFAKTILPMRGFTFFEWFYKIVVLVREQLSQMYCDGLIHGFISSEMSEKLLQGCVDGTFLIRFSETFCGAISIAYIKNRKFDKLLPWDLDRLKKLSLPDTIKCTDFLLYLYPNVPKNEVFSKYYIHYEITRSITGKDYNRDANITTQILTINTF